MTVMGLLNVLVDVGKISRELRRMLECALRKNDLCWGELGSALLTPLRSSHDSARYVDVVICFVAGDCVLLETFEVWRM